MASTVIRKRHRILSGAQQGRRTTKVADMTTDELREMMESLIDRKMSEWASDPHIARRRKEIAANAAASRLEYRQGQVRRGTIKDLMAELG